MIRKPKQQIAVVFYPGMTALDVVGTMEAMILLNANSPYRLVTVAERIAPVQTDTSLQMIPNRTFSEVNAPFGLLIPGGEAALEATQDETLRRYVQTAAATAGVVASVGTGSLILAAAGLLWGRQATTHWRYADHLADYGVRYVRRRWVEDGKFITGAGSTAGIDLGLYLVGKLTTTGKARSAQLIIEYEPQPPYGGIDWDQVDRQANDVGTVRVAELVTATSATEVRS